MSDPSFGNGVSELSFCDAVVHHGQSLAARPTVGSGAAGAGGAAIARRRVTRFATATS